MEQKKVNEGEKTMERVLYEVKKIIVGQDHLLERMIVALLATTVICTALGATLTEEFLRRG